MTLSDVCGECGQPIDLQKRLYRGPDDKPRCPICQVLAECHMELARVTKLGELLEAIERERGVLN